MPEFALSAEQLRLAQRAKDEILEGHRLLDAAARAGLDVSEHRERLNAAEAFRQAALAEFGPQSVRKRGQVLYRLLVSESNFWAALAYVVERGIELTGTADYRGQTIELRHTPAVVLSLIAADAARAEGRLVPDFTPQDAAHLEQRVIGPLKTGARA